MKTHAEWVQTTLVDVLPSLSAYVFEFNNRELAAIVWMFAFIVFSLSISSVRVTLCKILLTSLKPRLAFVWVCYAIWITIFVLVANWLGVWKTELLRETLVWSMVTGIALIIGSVGNTHAGYFRQKFIQMSWVAIILGTFLNLAPFSIWVELALQPLIFIMTAMPIAATETKTQRIVTYLRNLFFILLLMSIFIHTFRTLRMSHQILDGELFRVFWLILLSVWILVFVFGLVTYAKHE